ncbi:glycine cleavage system protein GcvH [Stigmatella aurantiaca]|uniref:Glycine cleavage system H protein n=1 Tax=Stigmatella aurantiaca (strain DW4/3-1) TaxID=378806 RepID=Q08QG7_STIAD|nr:glycine cleavage system protein GcvH [Stigmatella aurantiaca]ADO72820.1 Glycine cleavage system H protein [Stigmatella aurantiaca DW4/3-1]EAU62728.1 glycine cleavage system H protein [Stigmatella aurantiaca DW4/3-1]
MAENIPADLKYTREHEWTRAKGHLIVVGITDHAQSSLGDVVYVELPKVGASLTEGKQFGVIESTKAVSELYSPVSGKVVNVNQALVDNPSTVNTDPYGEGWILEVEPSDTKQLDGLLDAAAYTALLQNT